MIGRAPVETTALRLQVEVERLECELTAEAGLLVAAERNPRKGGVRHVDPDRPRLDARREAVPARGIARPDGRHQPVAHVVREADRVLLILEGRDGHDRAEDLLLRDLELVRRGDDGRRIERACALGNRTTCHDFGTLAGSPLDVTVDARGARWR